MHLIFALIASAILFVSTSGQTCTPLPKKADLKQLALDSDIAIVGKVGKKVGVIGKGSKKQYNITVSVDTTFKLNNGGLKKKKKITVGPFGKGENCIDIKKGKALFFLKPSGVKSFYWLSTNPKVKVSKKEKKMVSKFLTPPSFKKTEETVSIRRGLDVKKKCKPSGKPDKVYWTFNGNKLQKPFPDGISVKGKKKPKLEIRRAELDRSGVYVCVAHNSKLNVSAQYTLNINVQNIKNCNKCSSEGFCVQGICCQDGVGRMRCLCYAGFGSERCNFRELRGLNTAGQSEQTAAILGLCLAIMVSVLICVAAYFGCRGKKKSSPNPETYTSYTRKTSNTMEDSGEFMDGRHSTSVPLMSNLPPAVGTHQANDETFVGERGINSNNSGNYGQGSDLSSTRAVLDEPHHPRIVSDRRSTSSLTDSTKKRQRLNGLAKSGPFRHDSQRGSSSDAQFSPTKLEVPQHERLGHNIGHLQNEATGSRSSLQHQHAPQLPMDNGLTSIVKHQPTAVLSGSASNLLVQDDREDHIESPLNSERSSKNHKVTTFEPDGKIQQEKMGRDEGTLSSVTSHSPALSPEPTPRQGYGNVMSSPVHSLPSTHSSPPSDHRHFQYDVPVGQKQFKQGPPRLPYTNTLDSNRTENEDPFGQFDVPDTSLNLYGSEKQSAERLQRQNAREEDEYVFQEPSSLNTNTPVVHQLPLLLNRQRQYPDVGSTLSMSTATDPSDCLDEPESPSINV